MHPKINHMDENQLDWRVKKTLELAHKSRKKEFTKYDMREYYITATGNLSLTSFMDFYQRLKIFKLIIEDGKTVKLNDSQ